MVILQLQSFPSCFLVVFCNYRLIVFQLKQCINVVKQLHKTIVLDLVLIERITVTG